jgi:electron transfer flavoprotein beta subunit
MSSSARPDGRPLVVACLRITDLRPRVDPITGSVSHDRWGIALPAADAAALEHALRAAETWGGRVLALSAGPPSVEPALAEARALGASILRIAYDGADDPPDAEELVVDEQELARLIAAALVPLGPPALVVCGDRSADRGTGALPAFLAHELGAAQALGLVRLEPARASAPTLIAERRLDGGWRERLRVPLPAVCSVEPAGVTLRRASLAGALASAGKPVPVRTSGPGTGPAVDGRIRVGRTRPFRPRTRVVRPPGAQDPRTRLLALTGVLETHDPPTIVGPVDAPAAADALVDFLVRHAYLASPPSSGRGDGEADQ